MESMSGPATFVHARSSRVAPRRPGADTSGMNPITPTPSPDMRVLAMTLSDTRQQIAAAGAAQAHGAPVADVILDLSTAAKNLTSSS